MVKEILLPINPTPGRKIPLPRIQHRDHLSFTSETGDQVNMIGHNQKQSQPPFALFVVEARGGEDRISNAGQTELIGVAVTAANRDEEIGAVGIDPGRYIMSQPLVSG